MFWLDTKTSDTFCNIIYNLFTFRHIFLIFIGLSSSLQAKIMKSKEKRLKSQVEIPIDYLQHMHSEYPQCYCDVCMIYTYSCVHIPVQCDVSALFLVSGQFFVVARLIINQFVAISTFVRRVAAQLAQLVAKIRKHLAQTTSEQQHANKSIKRFTICIRSPSHNAPSTSRSVE